MYQGYIQNCINVILTWYELQEFQEIQFCRHPPLHVVFYIHSLYCKVMITIHIMMNFDIRTSKTTTVEIVNSARFFNMKLMQYIRKISTFLAKAKHERSIQSHQCHVVRGIHKRPVDSPHKEAAMWKVFSYHDVIVYGKTPGNVMKIGLIVNPVEISYWTIKITLMGRLYVTNKRSSSCQYNTIAWSMIEGLPL